MKTFPAVAAPVHSVNDGVTHLPKKGLEWSEDLTTCNLVKHRTGRPSGVKGR